MLKIITGRTGSGKTQELISLMKESEKSIYIVPEQYSFSAEKKMTQTFGVGGLGKPSVYSFKRLGYFLEEAMGRGGRDSIDKQGRIMVLYDITKKLADSLSLFGGSAKRGDMAKEADVIITTMKQYDITREKLCYAMGKTQNNLLKKKLSDCFLIMGAYEDFLKEGYRDGEDVLENLIKNLDRAAFIKDCDIFIDSFTAFTPLEMKVVEKLATNAKSVTVALCHATGDGFVTAEKTLERLKKIKVPFGGVVEKEGAMYTYGAEMKAIEESFFSDVKYPEKTDKIIVYKAKNEYEEAIFAAREVERLCRDEGYRYRDIAVVARDMSWYEKEFTRVFEKFRIPLFMDKKTPLASSSAAIFMLSAIRIISRGWKNEAVFTYMKTAFSPLSQKECDELENYALAAGVRRDDWKMEEDWLMPASVSEKEIDEEFYERINESRRKLTAPIINLEKKTTGKKTGRELAVAFYEFLEECNLSGKIESICKRMEAIGEAFIASRTEQVYSLMIEILESFVNAFGEKKLSMEDFVNILSEGIESVEIGIIPSTADSVCAGSIDRARGHGAKCIILVGASEGRFPASPVDSGIFTNSDREELLKYDIELPPDSLGKTHMEESLIYSALTCATDRLSVSYCITKENPMPSVIVKRLLNVFGKACVKQGFTDLESITSDYSSYESFVVEYSKMKKGEKISDEWYTALDYYKNHEKWMAKLSEIEKYTTYENKTALIREELLRARYGEEIKTSVSSLEMFAKCPFEYFAKKTLALKKREELEVTAADSGTFLHEFVDMFGKGLKEEGKSWSDVNDEYINIKTEEIAIKLLGGINKHMLETSPRIRHLFVQLKRIAKKSVTVLTEHMKRGRFEPLGYEIVFDEKGQFKPVKITLPTGQKVVLRGRVDRADILESPEGRFVRIIDYKSGSKKFSLNDIYNGFDLQLAAYLTAICENGNYRPAGMLYFRIDDPVIEGDLNMSDEALKEKVTAAFKMDGLVLEDEEILRAMDFAYDTEGGVIPVKKKKDGGFSSTSKIAGASEFEALSKHVKKTVEKLSGEILSGKSSINPVRGACQWCEMREVCGFDTALKGCDYRRVEDINDKDVLMRMVEEQKKKVQE